MDELGSHAMTSTVLSYILLIADLLLVNLCILVACFFLSRRHERLGTVIGCIVIASASAGSLGQ